MHNIRQLARRGQHQVAGPRPSGREPICRICPPLQCQWQPAATTRARQRAPRAGWSSAVSAASLAILLRSERRAATVAGCRGMSQDPDESGLPGCPPLPLPRRSAAPLTRYARPQRPCARCRGRPVPGPRRARLGAAHRASAVASRGEEFEALGIESKNKTTSRKKPSGEKCCGGWCKCGQSAKMPGEGD